MFVSVFSGKDVILLITKLTHDTSLHVQNNYCKNSTIPIAIQDWIEREPWPSYVTTLYAIGIIEFSLYHYISITGIPKLARI